MRQKSFFLWALVLALLVWPARPVAARGADAGALAQCDRAAAQAAQATGVPLSVLMSIARVESGQTAQGQLHAWPWTVNSGGKGYFFDTLGAALDFAAAEIAAGNINFDVGCFQVNLRWHSKGFTSLENAFDPAANAAYAAQFLASLHAEMGDWPSAVAAYHSRTPEHAQRYLAKVKAVWEDLHKSAPQVSLAQPTSPRANGFPLLQAGQGANGSIVPQSLATTTRFSLR